MNRRAKDYEKAFQDTCSEETTAKTGKYEWAISLPTGNNLLVPKGKKKDDTNIFLKM